MDSSSIELPGSVIAGIEISGDTVKVLFEPAYIIKTMTGSVERTKWRQNGALVFEQAEVIEEPAEYPAVCAGGDVGENVYTYRDMIPVPLASQGRAHCHLKLENSDKAIKVESAAVRLMMEEPPKYIEHIRPG